MTSILTAYIMTVFVFLILPGPVNLAVINAAAKFGFKGALFTVVATNAASLVLIAIAGLLMAGMGNAHEGILDFLSLVGGLYLVYYGWTLGCDAKKPVNHSEINQNNTLRKMMTFAFLVGVSNPKDVIFFMTFFTPFVLKLQMDLIYGLLLLTIIWCILDYVILMAYGLGIAKVITPRRRIIVNYVCALLFVVIGIYAIVLAMNTFL